MARVLIFLALALSADATAPERLWPLPFGRTLTGGFADSRPEHFHGGVDLRTGPEHRPVVAPTDGFIERIAVAPSGYGRALYFRMADARTAVFGHLNEFVAPLETLMRDSQLVRENYRVDFATDSISAAVQFRRGDVIAYTGDSGAGPAHLHFEIREGAVQIDPLQFYEPRDSQPPVITGLSWIGLGDYDPLAAGLKLTLTKVRSGRWRAPAITAAEPVALFVRCYDPGPWGRNAVPSEIRLRVNGEQVYSVACGSIDLLGAKDIYDRLVYAERLHRDTDVRRLFCSPPPAQWNSDGSCEGWLHDLRDAQVEVEVVDRAGNTTTVSLRLTSGLAAAIDATTLPDRFSAGPFSLLTAQDACAAWAKLTLSGADQVRISPTELAFGDRLELHYDLAPGETVQGRYFYEQKGDGSKRPLWRIPGRTAGMSCYVMKAGTYGIGLDGTPPVARCTAHRGSIYVGLTDEASGIDDGTVRCRVDGEPAIVEFDFEARGGPIWTPHILRNGPHRIELSAGDRAGNEQSWVFDVAIP
ncbi:M23 family metallopeptidase [candidate division KSB1 bacterium]|nr:M23 family metallopeptidase [candidate division KSB1 bacterium]